MKAVRFFAVAAFAALAAAGTVGASGLFDQGEGLFRDDRPKEAIPVLEKAVTEPGVDERAWLYLGLSYQELGRYDDAAAALRKGIGAAGAASRFRHLFYYDLANVFVLQGKNSFAADMYGEAITADSGYAPSYLNRANARMGLKDYTGASADYSKYLDLEPSSPQKASIEEILRRLGAAQAEADRIKAEAEAKRLADEAAKKALMDQVSASLKAAADETTSISAGSGSVQGYGDELNLDQ